MDITKIKKIFSREWRIFGTLALIFILGLFFIAVLARILPHNDQPGDYTGFWGRIMYLWGFSSMAVIFYVYPTYFILRYILIPFAIWLRQLGRD
jgi:hypothetical protein